MKTKIGLSKQILSIFLCVVMLLSYVPMTAFAAEEDAVEVSTEAELIAALANGGNIILTDDITLSEENKYGLSVKKDTTINLNSHALTSSWSVLNVYSGCTLTVVGDGTISNADSDLGFAIDATFGGKVKILGGNVNCVNAFGSVSVDVSGGTIEMLYVMEESVATISGGVVENMLVGYATVTVSGGTFGFDPSEYLAEGYTATQSGDNWIVSCAGDCEYTYTVNDDGTHTISCDKCNYELTEAHTFVNGVCACGEPCPHTSIVDGVRYTVSQNRIVENCTVCSNHTATADLVIDDTVSTVYTGSDIKALKVVYSDNWLGGDLEIIYSNNINAGDAIGKISIDGVTAENTFKIEPKEISISWGATMFLPYNGASKVPEAYANGLLEGDTCTLTTEVVETVEGAGIIPGTWTAKVTALSNPNYKLPASGERVTASFEIVTGYQNYAPVVSGVDETVDGKGDGKITGVNSTIEYRKEGDTNYTPVTGTEITGLHDGVYYVRYAAKTYYNPSPYATVTIGAGRKLTVTAPQNQIGFTLNVDKTEVEYNGSITITLIIHDGYSKSDNFAVKLNGEDMQWGDFTEFITQGCTKDIVITVEGIADITPPDAEISIRDDKWSQFWNNITFGLFFKETQDVTITANDTGSGVKSIQYYLASGELSKTEVEAISVWVDYESAFKINPDNEYVIYAKITDNAGIIAYINSAGIVLDATAPTVYGIENDEVYYGDKVFKVEDACLDTLKVDGVDVTAELNGDNEYKIIADNAEHNVIAADKLGNVVEYKITVYKNYTVTYKADGEVVSTQTVGHGKDATAPAIPEKAGYTQTAPVWDKDGKNITADTEINAVYTVNKYTVTYKADGEVVATVEVEHGQNVAFQKVPAKDGYVGKWGRSNENITADTEINAVYTKLTDVVPDDLKPEDKTELEDAKKQLEEMLEDDGYTDDDKKDIQNAIDSIDDALEVIENVENVEDLIDKIPDTVTKEDEDAIKAADDAYNALTDEEKALVDPDAKKALDDAKAALAELNKPADTDSPQTGDNSNLWLWVALLFISGAGIFGITVYDRKRKATSKR